MTSKFSERLQVIKIKYEQVFHDLDSVDTLSDASIRQMKNMVNRDFGELFDLAKEGGLKNNG